MGETSQKSSSTRWFIAMMATHFVLSVPILSLVTMMYTRQNEMMNIEEECDLLERFPGFFRDIAQQEWHENNLVRSVPFTAEYIRDDCTSLIQAGNTKMCLLKRERATNHGCCKTSKKTKIITGQILCGGKNRTLAKFKGYQQYFQFDACSTLPECDGSVCSCEKDMRTAVYDEGTGVCGERYGICNFSMEGCCKCVPPVP
ncbi:uncharacterized protein [Argopecten irradians]|uniref:uncharacterized protein n=1 Tax=Argopecten irradians TaxID=31199 RepID=UPI00371A47F9